MIYFSKNHMHRFFNNQGSFVKDSIGFANLRISKENAFIRFSIKFTQVILSVQDEAFTSKNFEITYVGLSSFPKLIWGFVELISNDYTINDITRSARSLGPKILR